MKLSENCLLLIVQFCALIRLCAVASHTNNLRCFVLQRNSEVLALGKKAKLKDAINCMHDSYPANISLSVSALALHRPWWRQSLGGTGFVWLANSSCLSTAASSSPHHLVSNRRPAGPGQLDEGSRDVGICLLSYDFLIDFNYIFPQSHVRLAQKTTEDHST